MTSRAGAAVGSALLTAFLTACGSGDNSVARSVHAMAKPGVSLLDVIRDGEKAQKDGVSFAVVAQDCPAAFIELGRGPQILHIRVTQPQAASNPSSEPGYSEVGYGTREEFLRGLDEQLPSFYSCRTFLFRFGRDQVWPLSDSFTVGLETSGRIASVSQLKEEDF